MRKASESRSVGFTLVELLVVIAIIGLIISLILVAAADGVRRAEERATQSLITKLDAALNDRIDALLNTQPPVNQTHRYLASIGYQAASGLILPVGTDPNNPGGPNFSSSDERRAQVIAQFDYLRAELPDVFFLNAATSDGGSVAASYPLNFAAAPYPSGTNGVANFVLPLGNGFAGLPLDMTGSLSTATSPPQSGMFGASFSAAGGIYRNLGYAKAGYDGVDNNGDGIIDDLTEGVPPGSTPAAFVSQVAAQLAKHTHKTARSEMLYAILVEGLGPLGSSFNRDDFTAKEVQDTDGDGLPEFVDAWGEPLQFFRWPIFYGTVPGSSDSQMGFGKYAGFSSARQLDPLDANQLLVSVGWWYGTANVGLASPSQGTFSAPGSGSTNLCSQGAIAFMNYFHLLVEPDFPTAAGTNWDRGGVYNRRAYFSKFLILSAGPDHEPGVAQFAKDYGPLTASGLSLSGPTNIFSFPLSASMEQNALALIYNENQASQTDPNARSGTFYENTGGTVTPTGLYLQTNATLDDISNHNVSAPSTGVR